MPPHYLVGGSDEPPMDGAPLPDAPAIFPGCVAAAGRTDEDTGSGSPEGEDKEDDERQFGLLQGRT